MNRLIAVEIKRHSLKKASVLTEIGSNLLETDN